MLICDFGIFPGLKNYLASKIEIFVGDAQAGFKRLGYMSLDPNKQSEYMARELKGLGPLDTPAHAKRLSRAPNLFAPSSTAGGKGPSRERRTWRTVRWAKMRRATSGPTDS